MQMKSGKDGKKMVYREEGKRDRKVGIMDELKMNEIEGKEDVEITIILILQILIGKLMLILLILLPVIYYFLCLIY